MTTLRKITRVRTCGSRGRRCRNTHTLSHTNTLVEM
jgi:hypothetical protein